jgi:hypothetical protein
MFTVRAPATTRETVVSAPSIKDGFDDTQAGFHSADTRSLEGNDILRENVLTSPPCDSRYNRRFVVEPRAQGDTQTQSMPVLLATTAANALGSIDECAWCLR